MCGCIFVFSFVFFNLFRFLSIIVVLKNSLYEMSRETFIINIILSYIICIYASCVHVSLRLCMCMYMHVYV